MKKIILSAALIVGAMSVKAQSYIGYLTDNYSGVNSVIANPSNIVDSRFKTDINLIGVSAFFSNDYYGLKVTDAFNDDYDFDLDAKKTPTMNNNAIINADILGPSFMFNLSKKSSIAVFTRARTFFNVHEINGESINQIDNDFDENDDFNINEGDFYINGNAWAELGFTYARVLMDKEQHFLKGGLSLKYLQGVGNTYTTGKNVTINYDADGTDLGGGITTGNVISSGDIAYGRNVSFDDDDYEFEIPKNANGFGVDLGFTYEWRPNYADYTTTNADGESYTQKDKNKYKVKIGLSLTDLGSINYKDGVEEAFNIDNPTGISEDDIDNEDSLEDVLNNLYTRSNSQNSIKAILPTALHLNVDWSINNNLYLNLNTDLAVTSKTKSNVNSIANVASLTPRFESKWFSFYLPLSLVQYNGFNIGTGLRAGPFYLGSGSIVSLFSDESNGADVYAGVKIPVYQSRPKDKDGDGIINKLDKCPKTPGPIENNGCPWKDTDGDTVLDNEDQCIEEVGPVENKGCPWKDTDGDSLFDNVDNCPNEAGPKENNGCPWKDTDGDGIFDKDDKCIEEAGTVVNEGCPEPEVTETVQKTLNEYAKTILFNSGKSSIKVESTQVLIDIIGILKEYPNANFVIEGHTDSIGTAVHNQNLSESRAASVKQFLVEKGISATRLTSKGYGETKPVATNMYKAGRKQNRRVEINLIK